MTVVRRAAARRWSVVAAATLVLVALPVTLRALPAHVPAIPVDQLYQRIRASANRPYHGFAVSTGTAGLPALPQLSEVSRLLDGETRLRVWYADPGRWRVDSIDEGTERDLYQTPNGQVVWDFGSNQLTVVTGAAPVRLPRAADLVPAELGRRLLAAGGSDHGTRVPARRVAGMGAAGLRITPAEPDTTIGHVDIWADPGTGVPLQVEVTARGAGTPVLVTRFLDFAAGMPAASVLVPPVIGPGAGFTVTDTPDIASRLESLRLGTLPPRLAGRDRVDTPLGRLDGVGGYGRGFAQFVVLSVPRRTGYEAVRALTNAGGTEVELPGGEGVLISNGLLSVLAMDSHPARRNYLLAGLVDGALLQRAGEELSTYGGRG